MLRLARNLTAFSLCVLLFACEKEKRATGEGASGLIAVGYFNTVQVAISTMDEMSQNLRQGLSFFTGRVMIAQDGSNLDAVVSPPLNQCLLSVEEQVAMSVLRNANVGDLIVRSTEGGGQATVPKNKSPDFGFDAGGAVLGFGGAFQIETTGVNGSRAYQQDFRIPPMAAGLKMRGASWDFSDPAHPKPMVREFNLPTPVYRDLQESDVVVLDKTKDMFIDYTAPEGTTYVKVTLNDGAGWVPSSNPYGNVTCYGSPTGPIWVPAGTLNNFKSSADAMAYIDFVSVSRKTDIPNVKESVILSVTRHMHGFRDFKTESGNVELRFGMLQLQ